jgi:arylformamidase
VADGLDVAVVNYDLCPVVDIGTIIEECRDALAWLATHGGGHGVAAHNIVVTGNSAGGHLAAVLHATDWSARGVDARAIRASVSLSGVFDLAPLMLTSLNADLRLDATNAAAWSPVRMQPTLRAPFLLAVGSAETSEFIRQSQLQWDAWPSVRPQGSTGPLLVDGCNHFSALDRFADPSHPLYRETVSLFG